MNEKERKQILNDMNTDDFNTMRSMLSTIEMKIMQLDPMLQREFYKPIKTIIWESWKSACNSENEWLYKDGSRIEITFDYLEQNGFKPIGVDLWHFQGFRVKQSTTKKGHIFFFCVIGNKPVKYADELSERSAD